MRDGIHVGVRLALFGALALSVTACSDAPSASQVAAAVARLQTIPAPDGADVTVDPPSNLAGAGVVVAGDVFRTEHCSDGECPMLTRYFSSTTHSTLDDACAAFADYVRTLDGTPPSACPPPGAKVTSSSAGQPGQREDIGAVGIAGNDLANTVVCDLAYETGSDGEWADGTTVTLTLGVAWAFGRD